MAGKTELIKIHPESFRANIYTTEPFRMIGLVDVSILYSYGLERVTLAYFRSSGTNSGKIKGLWYPIAGIKLYNGRFTEFTDYINYVLTNTTKTEEAHSGWLAKSLFFGLHSIDNTMERGFSYGKHNEFLFKTGKTLRDLYETKDFIYMKSLNANSLNSIITSKEIYPDNKHTQRENFERFIEDIFEDYRHPHPS